MLHNMLNMIGLPEQYYMVTFSSFWGYSPGALLHNICHSEINGLMMISKEIISIWLAGIISSVLVTTSY